MKTFTTKIRAIDPLDGDMKTWSGPYVQAETWDDAEEWLQENGLGYCEIDGELTNLILEGYGGIRIDLDNSN